jgi:hypothetical protein
MAFFITLEFSYISSSKLDYFLQDKRLSLSNRDKLRRKKKKINDNWTQILSESSDAYYIGG